MKKLFVVIVVMAAFLCVGVSANALIIDVSGDQSSLSDNASIIAAPANAKDDAVDAPGMRGFDEAQDVVTMKSYQTDQGTLPGWRVYDSHMIFLNLPENDTIDELTHFNVKWEFDSPIRGVMSNKSGSYEAASTDDFGAPGTAYETFSARGLENMDYDPSNAATAIFDNDGYAISADLLSITVGMSVTQPGDWMRVITAESMEAVPEPTTMLLLGTGLFGFAAGARRKMKKS